MDPEMVAKMEPEMEPKCHPKGAQNGAEIEPQIEPEMDTKLGRCWNEAGAMLERSRDDTGTMLGGCW